MNRTKKLEAFAERELAALQDKLIVSVGSGALLAFGTYKITPVKDMYVVSMSNRDSVEFGSKKSAISWCIADKRNQFTLARTIHTLDNKKHSLAADIKCRQALAEKSRSADFYESVTTKVQSKKDYLSVLDTELEKCLNSTKYMQIRGFSNETARTGRSVANKTNR